jgi:hypothetical protein
MPVNTNILRIQPWDDKASVFQTSVESDDETDHNEEPVNVFAGESSQPKRKVRFDGVEVPTRNQGKDKAKPTKPVKPSKPTAPKNVEPAPVIPRNTTTPFGPRPTTSAPSPTQPQYRYQSPIEDSTVAKSIIDRALDATISLTQRELLAISPYLRRQMKELTTSKKIPNEVGLQEVLHASTVHKPVRVCDNCDDTIRLIVSKDSLPLRAVYPLTSGTHKFENVLDSGSQIIGMREDIWEAIGDPMHNSTMTMQAANNTHDETMGKLRDVRFTFGDLDFYLQVQVVKNAPYEILLGETLLRVDHGYRQTLPEQRPAHYPHGSEHRPQGNRPHRRTQREEPPRTVRHWQAEMERTIPVGRSIRSGGLSNVHRDCVSADQRYGLLC